MMSISYLNAVVLEQSDMQKGGFQRMMLGEYILLIVIMLLLFYFNIRPRPMAHYWSCLATSKP